MFPMAVITYRQKRTLEEIKLIVPMLLTTRRLACPVSFVDVASEPLWCTSEAVIFPEWDDGSGPPLTACLNNDPNQLSGNKLT